MLNSRTLFSRLSIQYDILIKNKHVLKYNKKPLLFSEYYLKNKNKQERIRIIKAFYDYILR